MKKVILTAFAMLSIITTASAQFSTGKSSAYSGDSKTDNYSRIYGSLLMNTIDEKGDDDFDDVEGNKGFNVGFAKGINIMNQSMPLFLEVGAELNGNFAKEEYSESDSYYKVSAEYKYKFMDISVPLNVTYILTLPNGNVDIAPFAGLNLKFNLVAKEEYTSKSTYGGETEFESGDFNFFDEDDMGEDYTAKRFQVGMNLGANVYFGNFMVGYRFQPDFTPLIDVNDDGEKWTVKNKRSFITVGYKF